MSADDGGVDGGRADEGAVRSGAGGSVEDGAWSVELGSGTVEDWLGVELTTSFNRRLRGGLRLRVKIMECRKRERRCRRQNGSRRAGSIGVSALCSVWAGM